jgi:hypothetical protein
LGEEGLAVVEDVEWVTTLEIGIWDWVRDIKIYCILTTRELDTSFLHACTAVQASLNSL